MEKNLNFNLEKTEITGGVYMPSKQVESEYGFAVMSLIAAFFSAAAFVLSLFEICKGMDLGAFYSFFECGDIDFIRGFFAPLPVTIAVLNLLSILLLARSAFSARRYSLQIMVLLFLVPVISIVYALQILILSKPDFSDRSSFLSLTVLKAILFLSVMIILAQQAQIKNTLRKRSRFFYKTPFDIMYIKIRKFISKYYYIGLIVVFNGIALLFYISSLNFYDWWAKIYSIDNMLWKTFPLIFPLAPVYSVFLIGFNEKEENKTRLICFISGGFFSVINMLIFLKFYGSSTTHNVMAPFLLILLVLGCFLGRESGIMGFKWKKMMESYEKSENERKAAQRITRYYG